MACEWVKFGDSYAMCCSGNKRPQWCAFCHERPATKLCDAKIIDFQTCGEKTCDAPICDQCATHAGKDIDYCPRHKEQAKQGCLF